MNRAYKKDIARTILKNKKRFFSILLITVLGVTTLNGLKAGCNDLRISADTFYDQQNLYDMKVLSTLGLDDHDVKALETIKEVKMVEGIYEENITIEAGQSHQSVSLQTLTQKGINKPYILEGKLPEKINEIAVSEKYIKESHKKIGDLLKINDKDSTLKQKSFKITAIILDPSQISADEGSASFRSTAQSDNTFYVLKEAFDNDIYTTIYITLNDTKELLCYSDEYEKKVNQVVLYVEKYIKEDREKARYQSVINKAREELNENKEKIDKEFLKASQKLKDAQKEIDDGLIEIKKAYQQIKDNQQLLEQNKTLLMKQMKEAYLKVNDGFKQLQAARKTLDTYSQQLNEGIETLTTQRKQLEDQQKEALFKLQQSIDEINQKDSELHNQQRLLKQNIENMINNIQDFPRQQWNDYDQALYDAYLPLARLNSQLEMLKQENKIEEIKELEKQILEYQNDIENKYQQEKEELDEILSLHVDTVYKEQIMNLTLQKAIIDSQIAVLNESKGQLELKKQEVELSFQQAFEIINQNEKEIYKNIKEVQKNSQQIDKNYLLLKQTLETLKKEENQAYSKINKGLQQIIDGQKEIEKNEQKLIKGQKELDKQKTKFEEQKNKANQKIDDAQKEIDDIDMAKWYIQTRNSIGSYTSIDSDASSIETVGTVFPIIFLSVAILISLTTITRMVEEERSLIGTYKALGFSDMAICSKYLIYSLLASISGGILGNICGFIFLPQFLFTVFAILYKLPFYSLSFDMIYGIGGTLLFIVGAIFATLFACRVELLQMPALLMRPKAPSAGARILLERINYIWQRLSFLNKVTFRNLIRYKKRMFMTIGGIMGCTALLLCGFAIKDSVTELMPNQYERIYRYDFMGIVSSDYSRFEKEMKTDQNIKDYIHIQMESVKVKNHNKEESIQLMVFQNSEDIDSFLSLNDINGKSVQIEDGIYITQNVSEVLEFKKSDQIAIQNIDLIEKDVIVKEIVQNYLGNTVYMTQNYYEELFGKYEPNGFLAHFSSKCHDPIKYAEDFEMKDHVLSSISIEALKEQFYEAFSLIHTVVYIITLLAAGLAFVVLFTLSSTNISERERELATIKVLGFFDGEVHQYVHKETLILTLAGIILGLPLGRVLSGMLTAALKMPSIYFAVYVHPISYVYAIVLTIVFAIIVNYIMNKTLDKIDMIEALKSVE